MPNTEYQVVDNDLRETLARFGNRHTGKPNPLVQDLIDGKTVFAEGESKKFASLYESARKRGFKMSLRKHIIENVQGCVFWWELVPATKEGK